MNDEKLKNQLGANIASYRKSQGLTQAGLAEKLNYSDKAVSKWERGESAPDVLTLVQLAELFENLGVYWATVLGNHEGDGFMSYGRENVIKLFSSYEHCLVKEGKDDVDGNGNCTINVLNSPSRYTIRCFHLLAHHRLYR